MSYARISSGIPWNERFALYRQNYAEKQRRVDDGLSSWDHGDPYEIADWIRLFTPIEAGLWSDIRAAGLPLWPQLPVGRYFVDFGNPVHRVAVECDGREFHQDKAKDERRDAELQRMGWTVYRIDGWLCKGQDLHPDDDVEKEERAHHREHRTPAPLIRQLRDKLERNAPRARARFAGAGA
jgi:hypothetical protein